MSSIEKYREVLASSADAKEKESAIYGLAKGLAEAGRADEVSDLLVEIRPLFEEFSKARTAKVVRRLVDIVGQVPHSERLQANLCTQSIKWCISEGRTFLKQRIEAKLAGLLLAIAQYQDALKLISRLSKEVKKIDDKLLLVEIFLVESRIHLALKNVPKSKGALTAARTSANAIYCPPLLQAQIDMQAGILCLESGDFKTGFSYFFEALEGFGAADNEPRAMSAIKYMILAKIKYSVGDVYSILHGKAGVKYASRDLEAMKAIADAHKARSIHAFKDALANFPEELEGDDIIKRHLGTLHQSLLEANLLRIIEPFSRVQVTHVAKLIDLPVRDVEDKLSQMILDNQLSGTLDAGAGDLIVFDEQQENETFALTIETIKELDKVVDQLHKKAQAIG